MTRPDPTNTERQKRQIEREREAGIARVLVRIPEWRRDEINRIAAEWREQERAEQST